MAGAVVTMVSVGRIGRRGSLLMSLGVMAAAVAGMAVYALLYGAGGSEDEAGGGDNATVTFRYVVS